MAFLNAQIPIPSFISYMGQISFGLYVYHSFAFAIVERFIGGYAKSIWSAFMADAVSVALTMLVATISYRLFETRFLRLKERFVAVKSGRAVLVDA